MIIIISCLKTNIGEITGLFRFSSVKLLIIKCNAFPCSIAGETCIHIAAQRNHLEIVKLLSQHGADINARVSFSNKYNN